MIWIFIIFWLVCITIHYILKTTPDPPPEPKRKIINEPNKKAVGLTTMQKRFGSHRKKI